MTVTTPRRPPAALTFPAALAHPLFDLVSGSRPGLAAPQGAGA